MSRQLGPTHTRLKGTRSDATGVNGQAAPGIAGAAVVAALD